MIGFAGYAYGVTPFIANSPDGPVSCQLMSAAWGVLHASNPE